MTNSRTIKILETKTQSEEYVKILSKVGVQFEIRDRENRDIELGMRIKR